MKYKNIEIAKYVGDENARYVLKSKGKRLLVVLGANPSVADKEQTDRTINKIVNIAKYNGFDGFLMLNIYPQRATKPDDLHKKPNVDLHRRNLACIECALSEIKKPIILMAYGNLISKRDYLSGCLRDIYEIFRRIDGVSYKALKLNKSDHPSHPLFLQNNAKLIDFNVNFIKQ